MIKSVKNKRNILFLTLLVILFVISLVVGQNRLNAATYGPYTYSSDYFGNITITKYDNTAAHNLEIPSEIDGKTVKTIANYAFQNCTNLTGTVTIPDTVTSLGNHAFYGCSGISNVVLGNGVQSLGTYSFGYCSNLSNLTIPGNVQSVGYASFYKCNNLSDVTIENGVKTIGDYVFMNNPKISTIIIPDSVTSIGKNAFNNLSNLSSVTLGNGLESIDAWAFATCPKITEIIIPESVKTINDSAFNNCTGLSNIVIPDSNISFGENVFYNTYWYNSQSDGVIYLGNKLYKYKGNMPVNTSITVQDGTTEICGYAFYGCTGLVNIDIPESVTRIDIGAFRECTNLPEVLVQNGVVGNNAFYGCIALANVTLKEGVSSVGEYAFYNCTSLTEIIVPSSVETIGKYAFGNCRALSSVTLNEGVTSIGEYAFNNCTSLTQITTPISIENIESYAFNGCSSLIDITINSGVVNSGLFNGCNEIKNVYFGNGVTSIAGRIFADRESIEMVTIENGSIGYSAFENCTNLTELILGKGVTSIGSSAFKGCSDLKKVSIKSGAIGNSAFNGCDKLTDLTLESGVTSIDSFAFYNLKKLQSEITIPDTVTNIGSYAFSESTSITKIIMNGNNAVIDSFCFANCENLEEFELNGSISKFGTGVFNNTKIYDASDMGYYFRNTIIKTAVIKEGTKEIAYNMFSGCENLKTLYINSSELSSLNAYNQPPLYGCNNLEKVVIVDTNPYFTVVDGIIYSKDMTKLIRCLPGKKGKVNIPSSVTTIGANAFYGCKYLEDVLVIPDTVTVLEKQAFYGCMSEIPLVIGKGINGIPYKCFANSKFNGKLIIPDNIKSIYTYAFYNCSNFTGELKLPESCIINNCAFFNCRGLTGNLVLPKTSMIYECAFALCAGLDGEVIFNGYGSEYASYTSLDSYCFAQCFNLKGVNNNGFKIQTGRGTFLNCSSLERITNQNIGTYAYAGCDNIKKVDVQLDNFWPNLFRGAKNLEEVNICSGVTSIEKGALAECPNLKIVRIPSSVTSINTNAFYKTENIQDIYVDNNRDAVSYAEYLESICPNVHYLDSVYTIEKTAPENVDIVDVETSSEEGYTFNSTYKFKVVPKEGYTLENIIVKVNIRDEEKEIIPQEIDGEKVYVIENIQNNIKLEVKADVNLQSSDMIEENS